MPSSGKATSDALIALIHEPSVDPNFLSLACKDAAELKAKSGSEHGKMLAERKAALQRYITEAKNLSADRGESRIEGKQTFEQKMVTFLQEKAGANDVLYDIYQGNGGQTKESAFFEASTKAWDKSVPEVLAKVEEQLRGPYTLGDQVVRLAFVSWQIIGPGGDH